VPTAQQKCLTVTDEFTKEASGDRQTKDASIDGAAQKQQ